MEISFIIPVYNAEKYIRTCINSILSIEMCDFEIILINDGSRDNSLSICRSFNNKCIKIINQKNKGASSSRNIGLNLAVGKYVWFVDADDYIVAKSDIFILKYLQKSKYPDILIFGYRKYNGKEEISVLQDVLIGAYAGIKYLESSNGTLFVWNKLYKRSFLVEHDLKFIEGTKNIEDFEFNLRAFTKANFIATTDFEAYIYNLQNEDSTSRDRSAANLMKLAADTELVHSAILEFTKTISDEFSRSVVCRKLNKSIAGFLYSLLIYNYPIEYVKLILDKYKSLSLYPVLDKIDHRTDKFLLFSNRRFVFLSLCYIKRSKLYSFVEKIF